MPAPRRPWPPSRPSRPPSLHESACERASRPQLPYPSSSRDPSRLTVCETRTRRERGSSGKSSSTWRASDRVLLRCGCGCGVEAWSTAALGSGGVERRGVAWSGGGGGYARRRRRRRARAALGEREGAAAATSTCRRAAARMAHGGAWAVAERRRWSCRRAAARMAHGGGSRWRDAGETEKEERRRLEQDSHMTDGPHEFP